MKEMGDGVQIFRDYRNTTKYSYAYRSDKRVPAYLFQELRAIEIIEKRMTADTLSAYC